MVALECRLGGLEQDAGAVEDCDCWCSRPSVAGGFVMVVSRY